MEHWYLLSEPRFAEYLARAAGGEAPDMLMAEAWATAHECCEDHALRCGGMDLETGMATFSIEAT